MAEKQNLEWKAIWKDDYLAWICGFANAQGGKLYVGVDDNGTPVGLANGRKLLEDLPNKIRDAMGIIVNINLCHQDNKEYLEIEVPPYPIAISCKGVYYYRSGSTNQKLTGPELERFILRRRGATWDNIPLPTFSLGDVNDEVISRFKNWAAKKGRIDKSLLEEPKDVLLEKLHLTNGEFLTNSAMLLFSTDPERWLLGAYTKIGFFENDADLLYQDEVHGALLDQIDRVVDLVHLKYMKAKISYEGMQRIERYFVPEEALREALLNALCHKDYCSGIPIQISIYEDKLYIANCGQLPENWTIENLMSKHASKPFNPNIAHVFYLAGFIESWGRGIEKICNACREDGVPQPEYTIHPGDIMIKFTAPADRLVHMKGNDNDSVVEDVVDHVVEILALIKEMPDLTAKQIGDKLSISDRQVQRIIKKLKDSNKIKRIGSDRKGHWEIIENGESK